jgi:hypothetical protein
MQARSYRVYRFDGRGRIRSGQWFDALDDEHACHCALDHCDDGTRVVEVWERARLVRRIVCSDAA